MLKDIEAVIFDLDGTLIDSMWLWGKIDKEYLKRYSIDAPSDIQSSIEGMSFKETAEYFKNRFNIPHDIETIMNEWNNMAVDYYENKIGLKKGVREFLDFLKENNISMGIATSNFRPLVESVLKANNICEYFSSVRTANDVERGKPSPDIYLMVAKDLGIDADKCLVFEDVPNGIRGGKAAGMKVCAVYDETTEHVQEEKVSLADYYIEDYDELNHDDLVSKIS